MRLGNGRFESTVFNSRLQPTQIGLGTSTNNTSLLKLNYDYGNSDNNGNVKSQAITVPGMTHPLIQTYTYDSLNRLQSATETSNNTQTWKQTFSFDRYGNRRFDTSNNNTTTLPSGYDPNVFNPTFNPSTNRMNDNQGYDYDLAGNVTKDATDKRFIYDAENKQTSFGTNGSSTNGGSYFYDGDGKRIKKIVGTETTIFVYNASGQMVAEYSTTAPTNPQTSYLTTDTLGSPRINTNASGQVAARHDYLPFGEEINAGVGGRTTNQGYPQPLAEMANGIKNKFTGQIRDGESGLDYFLARYYSNKHGRFTSVDPENEGAIPEYPQSWNGYAYVINRPLVLTDPDGRDFRICDLNGECVVVSDEFAKTVTFNKDWQKQSGYYTKGDGKFYSSADGSVIGTYRNLGCDCWPDWNKAVVNEVDEQIRNPLTWIAGAAGAVFSTKIRPIKPSNLPSSSKMYIDMNEVLSGHTKTGNRAIQSATNAGTKNAKDLFPDGWTPTQIEEAIWDAYEHSKKVQTQGDRVRVRGVTRSGMIIEMWVNVKDKIIETAYPKGYVNK
jgi:RHS repeat-associated protein